MRQVGIPEVFIDIRRSHHLTAKRVSELTAVPEAVKKVSNWLIKGGVSPSLLQPNRFNDSIEVRSPHHAHIFRNTAFYC